jgi:hypothetical protein
MNLEFYNRIVMPQRQRMVSANRRAAFVDEAQHRLGIGQTGTSAMLADGLAVNFDHQRPWAARTHVRFNTPFLQLLAEAPDPGANV